MVARMIVIAFVMIIMICSTGCINSGSSSPPIQESSIVQPVATTPSTVTSTQMTTIPVSICDEWNSCGFGFGNFNGEPTGVSQRCHELYEMRMRNDQKVMNCLKNPYEASGSNAVVKLHCMQGVGTVEECAKYGVKLDRDNGNVIN